MIIAFELHFNNFLHFKSFSIVMVMTSELNQDQSYQTNAVSKGNSDGLKLSFAPVETTDVIETSFAVSLFLHLTSYENQITRLVPNDF